MENIDLHIHTTYSDGDSSIRDAIQEARAKNLTSLAITDHFTTSWKHSIINTLNFSNFEQYIKEIKKERELAGFNCLIGIEIDMESNLNDIKQIPFNQFEIILFEYVDSLVTLRDVISIKNELEIKAITALAHNSYFKLANLDKFSGLLVENNIYFELNSRYLTKIDANLIQKMNILKDHGVQFSIGSDAHTKRRIGDITVSKSILEKIDGIKNLIRVV